MEKDKEKWNKKYASGEYLLKNPSNIVKRFINIASKGKALDIACGTGRNALFLAEKGFEVDAIDISDVALENLKGRKNINPILADLDTYYLPEEKYNLILNINYLNRRLFPQIKEALKTGGVLIFETFTLNDRKDLWKPENRDYLLRKNELIKSFSDLHIIYFEEKTVEKPDGKKALVSSLVALKECLT